MAVSVKRKNNHLKKYAAAAIKDPAPQYDRVLFRTKKLCTWPVVGAPARRSSSSSWRRASRTSRCACRWSNSSSTPKDEASKLRLDKSVESD